MYIWASLWLSGKEHFNPWVREIPGGGHGNPLQYCCWENSMVRGAWQAMVHGVAKSQTWHSQCVHIINYIPIKISKKKKWETHKFMTSVLKQKHTFPRRLFLKELGTWKQNENWNAAWVRAGLGPHTALETRGKPLLLRPFISRPRVLKPVRKDVPQGTRVRVATGAALTAAAAIAEGKIDFAILIASVF